MASANLIIHLGALLTLLAIGAYALQLKKDLSLLRELVLPNSQKKRRLVWLDNFLPNLARALGVPFQAELKTKKAQAVRIDELAKFIKENPIQEIKLTAYDSNPRLEVKIHSSSTKLAAGGENRVESLGIPLHIVQPPTSS